MVFSTKNKIIASVLTVAMAISPVFIAPVSASDGQEVEEQASSWRYSGGEIVAEESVSYLEADSLLEEADPQMTEDYNAQMGSSVQAQTEEQTEVSAEEQPAVQTEETAQPQEETTAESPAEISPEEQVMEPEGEQAVQSEGEQTLQAETSELPDQTAQVTEEPAQAPQTAQEPVQAAPQAAPQDQVAAMSATAKNKYWTWSSGKYKRGPGYLKGIDVSYWQGKINWKKVKAAGVDFAIIRCGYGPNTTSKDDSKFAANVAGCKANGIPYGVYLYSYANTVSEAKDEADHAIRLLKANKCKLSYPIYYDLEDKQVAKASDATIRKMANAFCSKLRNSGYASGVYASLSWWNDELKGFSGYDRWVAQWAKSCSYKSSYSVWQCTSEASVSGISGRIDANLLMCSKASMDKYMKTGVMTPTITYALKTIDGKKYAVGSNGAVVKNKFFKVGAYTYAFDKDGVMITGRKHWIANKAYTLDAQGRAYINKSKTKKKASYYAKAGSGKKGTLKKGKSFYVLRTSGKWSQMSNGYWVKTSLTKKTAIYPTYRPSVTVKYKAKLKKKARSYSGPTTKYIKKKTFKKNKTVTVIGTYGSWSKLSSGQWLPSSKLRKK